MKKGIIAVSALVLALSVTFTACGNPVVLVDESGNKHNIVTDKNKDFIQDKYGNLYEEVENNEGQKVTQLYNFPEIYTNKRNTQIENAIVKVKVPRGWETSGFESFMRICHKGECRDLHQTDCQIEFSYDIKNELDAIYNKQVSSIKKLESLGGDITDVQELTVTLLGKEAKVLSYRAANSEAISLYYCFEYGEPVVEINATIFDSCFTREEIEEVINSCATLKKLGDGTTTTAPATITQAETTTSAE